MKVFKAEDYGRPHIIEVEIEGMTEKFVKFSPPLHRYSAKREAIQSVYHRYCLTRGEAKQWFLDRTENNLETLKQRVKRAEQKLEEIKKL